jgi:hypothetical protein
LVNLGEKEPELMKVPKGAPFLHNGAPGSYPTFLESCIDPAFSRLTSISRVESGIQPQEGGGNLCADAVNCFTALLQIKPKMMSRNEAQFGLRF